MCGLCIVRSLFTICNATASINTYLIKLGLLCALINIALVLYVLEFILGSVGFDYFSWSGMGFGYKAVSVTLAFHVFTLRMDFRIKLDFVCSRWC